MSERGRGRDEEKEGRREKELELPRTRQRERAREGERERDVRARVSDTQAVRQTGWQAERLREGPRQDTSLSWAGDP